MLKEDHSHNPADIKARLAQGPEVSYLKEWVYGAIDGVVTTFAVVAGVSGASLSPSIILILGAANLLGDGFSMAASAYSSARTDEDLYAHLRGIEKRHIEKEPEGEKEEIRQIYAKKGFSGAELEKVVAVIAADRKTWVDVMMQEEYGVAPILKPPIRIGVHTFVAFILCGALPLLPFIFNLPHAFGLALGASALTFFGIGSFKARWSVYSWLRLGFETLFVGLTAAGLAYLIGYWLRGLGL